MKPSPGWHAHADQLYAQAGEWIGVLVGEYEDERTANGQAAARFYVTGLALDEQLTRDSLAVALAIAAEKLSARNTPTGGDA